MAGRKVFTSGEILLASDVNSYLMDQSVMVFADSTARSSAIPTPTEGMVTYVKDSNRVEVYDGAAFGPIGGILQVIRATDTTNRTTTSTSFIDTGLTVSITPQSASSNLIVFWTGVAAPEDDGESFAVGSVQITDSSDIALSGAEAVRIGGVNSNGGSTFEFSIPFNAVGFVNAGSTSTLTFKGRFNKDGPAQLMKLQNASNTGQMIVMEVAV